MYLFALSIHLYLIGHFVKDTIGFLAIFLLCLSLGSLLRFSLPCCCGGVGSLITFFKRERLHIIYPHNHLVVVKALGLGKTAGWRAPAVEKWRETESLTLPPGPRLGWEE